MSDARQRYDEANIRFSSGQLPPEDEGFYSRQMTRATMERIEEVAASVAALTERVEALTRTVAARDDVRQPVPPPGADAGDAFKAGDLVMIGPWRVIHDVPEIEGMAVEIQHDQRGHEIRIDGILRANVLPYTRATALPKRSATAPMTITKKRIRDELQAEYAKAYGDPFGEVWRGPRRVEGISAVLRALGYEVID